MFTAPLNSRFALILLLLCLLLVSLPRHGVAATGERVSTEVVRVMDDAGREITLAQPAHRIVSLSPHLTEMLFAINAGAQLVGADSYSTYPEAAKALRRVGDVYQLDWEALLGLKPDLIVAWQSGLPAPALARLTSLGFKVFLSEPTTVAQMLSNITRLGKLSGHRSEAARQVAHLQAGFSRVKNEYQHKPMLTVYYEVWAQPPMTLAGDHIINELLSYCGGQNVFADLDGLAKTVSLESLAERQPDVILSSAVKSVEKEQPAWRQSWQQRAPWLKAVEQGSLFLMPVDIVQRNGPRLLQAAQQVCAHLETVRSHSHQALAKP